MATDTKSFNFEKSLALLEKIVADLESGTLPLEESLQQFEQGIKLTRECQQALDSAEQRVRVLIGENDGELVTRPFDRDAE